jgi:signal peptidase I
MMGDNRDNSRDSRYIGAIPETHLVGEAVRIWMHMDGLEWPDWKRIGTKIE